MDYGFPVQNEMNHSQCINISNIADDRLTSTKLTASISNIPPSMSEHFSYWKVSEHISWLLFCFLPVVSDIMEPIYWYHYCVFVIYMYILMQDTIQDGELEKCHNTMGYFDFMCGDLYGERYMNVMCICYCIWLTLSAMWVHSGLTLAFILKMLMESHELISWDTICGHTNKWSEMMQHSTENSNAYTFFWEIKKNIPEHRKEIVNDPNVREKLPQGNILLCKVSDRVCDNINKDNLTFVTPIIRGAVRA